jgi:hypothetical protein
MMGLCFVHSIVASTLAPLGQLTYQLVQRILWQIHRSVDSSEPEQV